MTLLGLRVRMTRPSIVRLGQTDELVGVVASTDGDTLTLRNVAGFPSGATVSTPITSVLTLTTTAGSF